MKKTIGRKLWVLCVIVLLFEMSFPVLADTLSFGSDREPALDNHPMSNLSYSPKILVTGFESCCIIYDPNPSQLIAENLNGQIIDGAFVIGITLPVVWDEAVDVAIQAIKDYNPDIVISLGTGVMSSIHVEHVGINIKKSLMPDNTGHIILFRKINRGGPFMYFSSIPTEKIVQEINAVGIPAKNSYRAGTFICNEVLYGICSYIEDNHLSIKSGFIHVPLLSSQDQKRGMELDTMIEAVKTAIQVSLQET